MIGKKIRKLLIGVVCAVMMLSFTFTAQAAPLDVSDPLVSGQIAASVQQFVEQLYTMGDEELNQMAAYGDFYQVAVEEVQNNRKTLGEFKGFADEVPKVESSDKDVTVTMNASFENYDAEIVMTLNADATEPKNMVINPDFPLSVKMAEAGQNTITGLLIVFVILIFLCIIISLFKYIGKGANGKKEEKAAPAPAPAAAPVVARTDDGEVIAAMAAAIAAAEAEAPAGHGGYVVYSVKRVGSKWGRK